MILCIEILKPAEVAALRIQLSDVTFVDGRRTAGRAARQVKQNRQADKQDEAGNRIKAYLTEHITQNKMLKLAAIPQHFSSLIISRYDIGMAYGPHVDNVFMGGLRTDLSFTLFLSEPDSYEGGDLVIDTSWGQQAFKPDAGSVILYPASTLHHVKPVISGTRFAAIGWIQSHVRDHVHREILFDLETTRSLLNQEEHKVETLLLLRKSYNSLLRLWAEN